MGSSKDIELLSERALQSRASNPVAAHDPYLWKRYQLPSRSEAKHITEITLFGMRFEKRDYSDRQSFIHWYIPLDNCDFCIQFQTADRRELNRYEEDLAEYAASLYIILDDELTPSEGETYWKLETKSRYAGPDSLAVITEEIKQRLRIIRPHDEVPYIRLEWYKSKEITTSTENSDTTEADSEEIDGFFWRYMGGQRLKDRTRQFQSPDRADRVDHINHLRTYKPHAWWRGLEADGTTELLVAVFREYVVAEYLNTAATIVCKRGSKGEWRTLLSRPFKEVRNDPALSLIRHAASWKGRIGDFLAETPAPAAKPERLRVINTPSRLDE